VRSSCLCGLFERVQLPSLELCAFHPGMQEDL
jgi:hypothetical protein